MLTNASKTSDLLRLSEKLAGAVAALQRGRPAGDLARLQEHLSGRKKGTAAVYRCIAARFQEQQGVRTGYSAEQVLAFIDSLGESSYRRTGYYALKAFFRATGRPWPDIPLPLEYGEPAVVAMAPGEVARLVRHGRLHGSDQERAVLAMATIYGLRRGEIADVRDGDIQRHSFRVRTLKGGVHRTHFVPQAVSPLLAAFRPGVLTLHDTSFMFKDLCRGAGVPRQKGQGWHSIRRALATGLRINGVSVEDIKKFLRWKDGDIFMRYYHPPDLDAQIFIRHPFLPLWR